MSDIDDLTEDDIPDLSDEKLERVVAEWSKIWICDACSGKGFRPHRCGEIVECDHCDGGVAVWSLIESGRAPNFCSDPAAAWRLQRRMPAELVWQYDKTVLKCNLRHPHDEYFWVESSQGMGRILAEAAAIIAVLGVEPREVE